MILKKYIIFQKIKNKLLLFKNQTSWKIYIFKIMYIKKLKLCQIYLFLNDMFL